MYAYTEINFKEKDGTKVMANEIKIYDNKGKEIDAASVNKGFIQNQYRRIQITCSTKPKKDGGTFKSIKGMMYLDCYSPDGLYLGKNMRRLDVHFTKTAFKGCPAECDVHTPEDLTTGFLYVLAKGIQAPSRYQVTIDEETGKPKYPSIWIKEGVVGFEPYVTSQDAFDYHVSDETVFDLETGKLTDDPEDTEETELKED